MTENGKNDLGIHPAKAKLQAKQMNQLIKTKPRYPSGRPRPLCVFTLMTRLTKIPMRVYRNDQDDSRDDSLDHDDCRDDSLDHDDSRDDSLDYDDSRDDSLDKDQDIANYSNPRFLCIQCVINSQERSRSTHTYTHTLTHINTHTVQSTTAISLHEYTNRPRDPPAIRQRYNWLSSIIKVYTLQTDVALVVPDHLRVYSAVSEYKCRGGVATPPA
ncbi:hypothetical protein CAPTEDRAFT_217941 [Capitella teleta]|uniref:Uncharacterized protein n=1 Tax=Capitella teleta TaxID=283909 RepID=R7UQN7_CAPTE|nr:hypothetical protein CAPTEDRAFT_217941 [Capitella teleta]|eukprot:ELU08423.1 hypothetical protein CAPTEDRAFT_217941 [Capitella teleta]